MLRVRQGCGHAASASCTPQRLCALHSQPTPRANWPAKHRRCARHIACRAAGTQGVSEQRLEELGRQLYQLWSSDDLDQLDDIVAENHAQQDEVWQVKPQEGRDWLKMAIGKFRDFFKGIQFDINSIKGHADRQQVFIHWTSKGTFEGEESTNSGISLLTINDEGKIARTQVYRQATNAEVAMAQRRQSSVPQSAILTNRPGSQQNEDR